MTGYTGASIQAVPLGAQEKAAAEEPAVDMQWAVKIPISDGVKLNATIFASQQRAITRFAMRNA